MLKKPASFVLASFRSSTYSRGYASGPSLAAALLDGIFEHPAGFFPVVKSKRTERPHNRQIGYQVGGLILGGLIDTCSKVHDNARNSGMKE
jgi:hypothetical protein